MGWAPCKRDWNAVPGPVQRPTCTRGSNACTPTSAHTCFTALDLARCSKRQRKSVRNPSATAIMMLWPAEACTVTRAGPPCTSATDASSYKFKALEDARNGITPHTTCAILISPMHSLCLVHTTCAPPGNCSQCCKNSCFQVGSPQAPD